VTFSSFWALKTGAGKHENKENPKLDSPYCAHILKSAMISMNRMKALNII
jgi:hypothetical protein